MIYVYRHAPVSKEHLHRAREIIQVFRENVFISDAKTRNGNLLREQTHLIDYGVKICGPSKNESKPSIVIFCSKDTLPPLKATLTQDHVRAQYCANTHSTKQSIWRRFSRRNSELEVVSKPSFELYFWPGPRSRELLWSSSSFIPSRIADGASPISRLTMCGAQIYPVSEGSRPSKVSSKIGCLIAVDCELYGLTAAHGYGESEDDHSRDSQQRKDDDSDKCNMGDPMLVKEECNGLIFEDDEYDLSSEHDFSDEENYGENLIRDITPEFFNPQDTNDVKSDISNYRAPTILPDVGDGILSVDLDWAAIKIQNPQHRLPNAYLDPRDTTKPHLLTDIASKHPGTVTPVHIISSPAAVKSATLLPGTSYLGGLKGGVPCEVWNVSLDNPRGRYMSSTCLHSTDFFHQTSAKATQGHSWSMQKLMLSTDTSLLQIRLARSTLSHSQRLCSKCEKYSGLPMCAFLHLFNY